MREARIEPKYKCNKCHQKKCKNCHNKRNIKKLEYKNGMYYNANNMIVKADPYGVNKRINN